MSLKRDRIRRLMRRIAPAAPTRGGVVQLEPGESADEGITRATAQGRSGGFLVVPPAMDATAWERITIEQQRQSAIEAAQFIRALGADEPKRRTVIPLERR